MNKTLNGIVLSMRDYREADVILNVFCEEEGMQSLVARGLRKLISKNAGSTQLFTHAKFHVDYHEQKSIHSMRNADIVGSYRNLREDLLKQAIGSILCECMEKTQWEDSEEAFHLLKQSFDHLQATSQPYALGALFLSIMNRYQGVEPYVEGCVACGHSSNITAISVKQGGFLCANCEKDAMTYGYGKADLKCFRLLCKAELEHFSIIESSSDWTYEHFLMVYRFFEEYSGIHLKSFRFLKCLQEL